MTSVARRREPDDSEEYSDASQDIELSRHDATQHESDYDSQGSDSEHSEQDPDNKESERRVDDDEDRSNPQYIPKRGTFYEHDDRTAASGEESTNTTSEVSSEKKEGGEPVAERRRAPRKSDIVNKWSHDKYNENEQAPKSREELVSIYGYDIRNEDAPPHARRNRRYGRGPTKYTRTWEDEEAYRRQSAAQLTPRKPPNPEDFPELDATKKQGKPRTPRPRSKSQPSVGDSVENGSLRRNASIKINKKPLPKAGTGRVPIKMSPKTKDKMPQLENLTITTNNNNNQGQTQRKVNATVAQQRPVPTDQGNKKINNNAQPQQQSAPAPNKPLPQQTTAPQQQQQKQQQVQQQNQQQQPASGGGSKRYSSLRQRPLAEPYTPQQQSQQQSQQQQPQQQQQTQPQQQHRYHAAGAGEFVGGAGHQPTAPHAHPQHIMHQQVRGGPHNASPPQHQHQAQPPPAQHTPQVRLGILDQQQLASVPHPHHAIHNMPPAHNISQLQPTQAYAPPAMMPAQYMQVSQPSATGPVFGGTMFPAAPLPAHAPHAPHAAHAPYQHQIYPHHNYATQAGGVTYYNCAEQEPPPPQPRAQRRPTAAIPIVSPHHNDRAVNSTEKDNIDRIVENMFVRKPWPTTHGDSKEKQDNRSSQEPPSKESSQPNSLTSSSISIDSKPSENREEKIEEVKEEKKVEPQTETEKVVQNSITTDA